jgi:hypothetical protein
MMASVTELDPAGNYNFIIRQGDTFSRGVALTNGGTAINLTGSSAVFNVAEQSSGSAVLSLTVGSGITMGGTAGTVLMTATSTQTGALDAGVYVYDFVLLQSSTVTTLFAGQFTVLGQV